MAGKKAQWLSGEVLQALGDVEVIQRDEFRAALLADLARVLGRELTDDERAAIAAGKLEATWRGGGESVVIGCWVRAAH